MANVMFSAVVFTLLTLGVVCQDDDRNLQMHVTPSLDELPFVWHTDFTIECTWDKMAEGDILVDGQSAWTHPQYAEMANADDPSLRVYASDESFTENKVSLTIKNIDRADEHVFQCHISKSKAEGASITIIEPPSEAVTNLALAVEYNDITISYSPVDEATVYKVGILSDGTSDWVEDETPDLTYKFEGLETATGYTVRVLPGNKAGYRESVAYTEDTTQTKDNRPPQQVEDLVATSAGYNISDISLAWSLETNHRGNHIITKIVVRVDQADADNVVTNLAEEELAEDAVEFSYTAPGPGNYIFTVTPANSFSEGVEGLGSEVSHEVFQTTEAPTDPPTDPPTEPPTDPPTPPPQLQCTAPVVIVDDDNTDDNTDDTSDDQTDDTSDDTSDDTTDGETDDTSDDTTDDETDGETDDTSDDQTDDTFDDTSRRRRDAHAYNFVKEVTADESLSIACYLASGATIETDEIQWSYSMPDSEETVDEAAMANDGITFESTEGSRQLKINKASSSHQGIFKCTVGSEVCSFDVTVQSKAVGNGAANLVLSSSLLLLGAFLLLVQ